MTLESAGPASAGTGIAIPGSSYLEWGAVFGGAFLAGAISVVLLQFAAGVGLAVGDPTLHDGSASWNVLVAGLWVALVALASSAAGGYVAGRMRSRWGDAVEAEVEFRDGAHGLVVWAVSTVGVALVMAAIAALSAVGAGAAAGAATSGDPSAEVLRLTANVSTIFGFATAAGAALGAAAAWYAAILGGEHRDKGTPIHEIVPERVRRLPIMKK